MGSQHTKPDSGHHLKHTYLFYREAERMEKMTRMVDEGVPPPLTVFDFLQKERKAAKSPPPVPELPGVGFRTRSPSEDDRIDEELVGKTVARAEKIRNKRQTPP